MESHLGEAGVLGMRQGVVIIVSDVCADHALLQ